ncbi:TetR/AcrR family transcriptional regulator [Hoeflea sp.]|uniref:TetR/AcrR family transcriptional regulator n=1 Tax=Hoeflea sp. TaxID=1940281 RepID=UPI003B012E13
MRENTRERLLEAAKRHFAERGFYGASIAQIAEELGITKQALLYHFKRKEDLYAEVLNGISETLLRYVKMAGYANDDPQQQLEHIVLNLHYSAIDNPQDSRILMRELLDNQARADTARNWYLVPFLDALGTIVKSIPGMGSVDDSRLFCFVYQMLGSIEYFVISRPTLERMYGSDHYERVKDHFPLELQNSIRRFVAAVSSK